MIGRLIGRMLVLLVLGAAINGAALVAAGFAPYGAGLLLVALLLGFVALMFRPQHDSGERPGMSAYTFWGSTDGGSDRP